MMISGKMNAKLNDQIVAEFTAAYNYLAMACALDEMGYRILRQRFHEQYREEIEHAERIVKYVGEVGGKVALDAVPKPQGNFSNPEAIAQAALDSEVSISQRINELVALADSEKDYATRQFLDWFVSEQVEEVSTMGDLLRLIQLAKGNMLQVEARIRHEMAAPK
ncbi:MAG: ferritin [Planctomycetes bacterium]|nr:ferritin [Planctomycetota bacterium]